MDGRQIPRLPHGQEGGARGGGRHPGAHAVHDERRPFGPERWTERLARDPTATDRPVADRRRSRRLEAYPIGSLRSRRGPTRRTHDCSPHSAG
jgi:hypothetical protein